MYKEITIVNMYIYIYIMFENVIHICVQFHNTSFHAVTINLEDKLSLSVVVNVNLIYQIKTEWKPVYFLFVLFIILFNFI